MTATSLAELRDEAFRKIGRNVHAFQRMEAVMKVLIATSRFDGPIEHFEDVGAKALNRVRRSTMGGLISPFVDAIYAEEGPEQLRLEGLDKAWLTLSYKVEADRDLAEERSAKLGRMVSERNRLVHRMIGGLDIESEKSCARICSELDIQYKEVKPELDALHETMQRMQVIRKYAAKEFAARDPSGKGDANNVD